MKTFVCLVVVGWTVLLGAIGLNIAEMRAPPSAATVQARGMSSEPERQGCCSSHGGVCGCSGSRAQCCDGSLSPSCGCYGDRLGEC